MNTASALAKLPAHLEVTTDVDVLTAASVDWWPLALLRRVRGDRPGLPAAVVRPRSTADVSTALRWATAEGVAVVPRGGGSGVCGGAVPPAGSVVLDMTALGRVLAIDEESHVVHTEAGILGDALEAALNERSLMLGHYPQSFSLSTVGGWIAATSAGQATPGFGFIEDRVLGLTVVRPTGEVVTLKPRPRSAAGPDLRRLFLGSEGTLGVVTEAWLAASPCSDQVVWDGFVLPTFDACFAAARAIRRAGIHPRINRGWDEDDSRHGFSDLDIGSGCVCVVGFTADEPGVAERQHAAADIYVAHGGNHLGSEPGERWFAHRLDAADVFRDVMGPARTLGSGVVIDTIEVAGLWSGLPTLYRGVRSALLSLAESTRCHFSHVYPTGACLYYTFILRDTDDLTVEHRYHATWRQAADACIEAGGTLTHHHGMGRLKAAYVESELGPEAAALLRQLKALLDPAGILNPGALLP